MPRSVRRSAVRPIARLDVKFPTVDQAANNQTTNPPENENGNVFVSNDCVGQTDEQPEEQANQPTGPRWQLHATDNKADGETTRECTEQCGGLIGKGHWEHQQNI